MTAQIRVLVADDEKNLRELLVRELSRKGHTVVGVPDGRAALDRLEEEIPDVLLLDIKMPRMTGYEACRRLKEIEGLRDIPVIFLSAKGQRQEIEEGLSAGAAEYILKPFAPEELISKVRQILGKQ